MATILVYNSYRYQDRQHQHGHAGRGRFQRQDPQGQGSPAPAANAPAMAAVNAGAGERNAGATTAICYDTCGRTVTNYTKKSVNGSNSKLHEAVAVDVAAAEVGGAEG